MNNKVFICISSLFLSIIGSVFNPLYAEDKFNWTLVTSWPEDFPILHDAVVKFSKDIERASNGRLNIEISPAYEKGGPFDVFDIVSKGIEAEMGHSAAYYWKEKIPAAQFMTTIPFGMTAKGNNAWFYGGDGLKLWQELYAPFDVFPFPMGNTGVQMGGWFKKKINTIDDFKGLKIRIPGLGATVLEKVGAKPQLLAANDIFSAFNEGKIDATEWIGPYHDQILKLNTVKADHLFYYYPGWHEPGTTFELTINKKAWNKLPHDIRQIIISVAGSINQFIYSQFETKNIEALRQLQKQDNVTVLSFPTEVLNKLRKKTKEVLDEEASKNDDFKRVYTAFKQFRKDNIEWSKVSDNAYKSGITNQYERDIAKDKLRDVAELSETTIVKQVSNPKIFSVSLKGDLGFSVGSGELKPELKKQIKYIARILVGIPLSSIIEVEGHTDNWGNKKVNIELSRKRANSVKRLLIKLGVNESLIKVKAMGDSNPVSSNETDEGRRNNRRVDIKATF